MKKSLTFLLLFWMCSCAPFTAFTQVITTIAGGGGSTADSVSATTAAIGHVVGMVIDNDGNLIIGDDIHSKVRKINLTTGIITTISGNGVAGYSGDGGLADTAVLNLPGWEEIDTENNIFVGDLGNNRIRKISASTNIITTYAGNGGLGYTRDGGLADTTEITNAIFAINKYGDMYIGEDSRIRKVSALGIITTVAGNGTAGSTGDGGPATSATINGGGVGMCADKNGNIYISYSNDFSVRKLNVQTGVITKVAGTYGSYTPYLGDGIQATASNMRPIGIAIDGIGNLYIADAFNNRIEKVDTFGIIHTIAGTGTPGYIGDGHAATAAELNYPENVAVDLCGNVYIADFNNAVIRKITYPPVLTYPAISITSATSAHVGSTVTVNAAVTDAGSSYIIHWMNDGVIFASTTVPSVTYTKHTSTDTITAKVVSTATYGCYDSTISSRILIASQATGIPATTARSLQMYIYPNPANDQITVSCGTPIATVIITDLTGRKVLTRTMNTEKTDISIHSLAPGMYFVTATDEDGRSAVEKLIKE